MIRATVLFVILTGVASAEPGRDDFAYEAPLALTGTASVYRAPLNADVYRNVTRADLGDVRVFNAAGEIVPHGLSRPPVEPTRHTQTLPVFPLAIDPVNPQGDVSLQVEVRKDGSIVKIKDGRPDERGRRAYLLDASVIDEPLNAVTFQWRATNAGDNLHRIEIDASDDLKTWRPLAQGILARLEYAGRTLERNRVDLPRLRTKYLRVLPADLGSESDFALIAVDGEFSTSVDPTPIWLAPAPQTSDKPDERRYDLNGKIAVDRVRIGLAPNSVVRVSVKYRAKDGEAWRYAGQKTVYRLETSGTVIHDDEIRFGRGIVASQWLIAQTGDSGGGWSQISALEAGWIPHDLVFVARGAGPFTLAYGRDGLAPVDNGIDELLRLSKRSDAQRVEIGEATLGPATEIRGAAALRAGWTAGWKSWLLWVVLLVGVGSLAVLAVRIGRQMRGGTR